MRAYIMSESPEGAISVSNAVSSSGSTPIISNRRAKGYMEMLDEIASQAGSYDLFFMVTSDPVNASIDANKRPGIRAYFCDNQKYVSMSRDAGANVIIFDLRTVGRPEYTDIISSIVSTSIPSRAATGIQKIIPFGKQTAQAGPAYTQPQQAKTQKRAVIDPKPKTKGREKEPEEEPEPSTPSQKQRTGLFGKLKDSLGIE